MKNFLIRLKRIDYNNESLSEQNMEHITPLIRKNIAEELYQSIDLAGN